MTTSKTTPSGLIGPSLTELEDKKAWVWFLSLRLWIWKNHPHLRERPNYPIHEHVEIEMGNPTDVVFFKHIYAVPVWNINQTTVAYWILMCYKLHPHGCIGTVKHLDYILDASKTKV